MQVYGIDMTPEMLAAARANAVKRNVTNVEFLQGTYISRLYFFK